jgi:hypothetical protein
MHLYEAGVDVTGVPSGFLELDKLTSGFQPGTSSSRGAAVDGEVGARALRPPTLPSATRRPSRLHARDVKSEVTQRLMCSEARWVHRVAPGSSRRRTGRASRRPATGS